MAVQITLRGVNFGNSALPVVGNMIRSGLRGAWRFGGGYESAADLSGNESILIEKGQVSFTPEGVLGDLDNGFDTGLEPTVERTFIAVFRVPSSVVDLTQHNAMIIGNYTDASERAGGCIWLDDVPTSVNAQSHFYDAALTENNYNGSSNLKLEYGSESEYQWLFVASVVTATKQWAYFPTQKKLGGATDYLDGGNQDYASRTVSPHSIELLSVPDSSWGRSLDSVVELSEVLIYDRALSLDEVKKQYEYSKDYHLKVKGIVI
ncbi:MAG: hypothetical protein RPT11_02875 [Bermanella sp.]